MKAIVYKEYGPPEVLHIEDIAKPVPKGSELLVKVLAAPVNYGDSLARNFKNVSSSEFNMPLLLWYPAKLAFGLAKPKKEVLGSEFAGIVEKTGENVKHFKKGDEVFGYTGQNMGTYAEYVCISETGSVTLKPTNMSFEEASTVPYGSLMSYNLLKKVNITERSKVLINGASGSIGSFAVQLAKHYGAEVTGVCGKNRMEFVKSLGADKVIDYKSEDFTRTEEKYDVVFDILGRSEFANVKNVLKENGVFLLASFKSKKLLQMLFSKIAGNKKVICGLALDKQEHLKVIKELVEAGKITTLIDRKFKPEQAAEAHRHYESNERKGNVIISCDFNN